MGEMPPQEDDGVGRFRKTQNLMVLKGLFPSFIMKKTHKGKAGDLGSIFGCFGALRGTPRVTNELCANPIRGLGRIDMKNLAFNGLKGTVQVFTHEKFLYGKFGDPAVLLVA